MPPTQEHEVLVLGAGSAGSAAATLLARRGHDVALIRPATTPYGALAESVPPSARKLLAELGALDAVERAGFQRNGGNTVWWAGQPARSESFADGQHGFHVERRALEDVLVEVAARAGARVYEDTTARSAREVAGGWTVDVETAGGASVTLGAPWVLDATGRRGVLARVEGRQHEHDTATLSLLGRWRRVGGWDGATASHTLVESYASGWAWSVPLSADVRCLSAMVDHRHEPLAGADPGAMLVAELAKTAHIGRLLEGSEPDGDAWACPASLYHARRYARRGLLLVGDAGSFIDPLSSFGVKKALSSGWLAGVVAHTALVDPAMAGVALDFFDAREREVYRRYRAVSAPYFREAAATYGHAYWRVRAEAAGAADGASPGAASPSGDDPALVEAAQRDTPTPDPDSLEPAAVPEAAVRAAFDVIRARERLGAIRGPTLRTIDRPTIEGYRVRLAPRLASDAYPEGIRFARSVDLVRLVELAEGFDDVSDLWSAYNGGAPPVALPDFVTALSTAFAAGFLVHQVA